VDTGFSQKNATKQGIRAVECVNQNKNRSNFIIYTLSFLKAWNKKAEYEWFIAKKCLMMKFEADAKIIFCG